MKKKILIASIIALSLALLVAVGGTIAWLIDTDGDVVNTFTPSDISIVITESDNEDIDTDGKVNSYKMIPGTVLKKDPQVTVTNDIDCYVYVVVAESANFDDFIMPYALADGWKLLPNNSMDAKTYVIYRMVTADAENKSFNIIDGNTVTVRSDVTKSMMNGLTDAALYPRLAFTPYAIQVDNIQDANGNGTAADEAWALASDPANH